jgi:hypothetical protein
MVNARSVMVDVSFERVHANVVMFNANPVVVDTQTVMVSSGCVLIHVTIERVNSPPGIVFT